MKLVQCPKMHEVVAIYSSKHNGFYRAKIIVESSEETDKFKCVFIDFGYFEIIASRDMFVLPNYISINKVSKNFWKKIKHIKLY